MSMSREFAVAAIVFDTPAAADHSVAVEKFSATELVHSLVARMDLMRAWGLRYHWF